MSHKVAVYGSLRKGFGNHYLLHGAKHCADGVTIDTHKMYSLGAFPAILEEPHPEGKGVVVEVYEVDDKGFAMLDTLEGYPTLYDRKVATIGTDDGGHVDAWIYYMKQGFGFVEEVGSNDWKEYNT